MSRPKKREINYSESFICARCGSGVSPPDYGTAHRNHCPNCLWSLHLDIRPGDRRSGCRGEMEPIGVWSRTKREWALIHRCVKCGTIKTNRISGDDNEIALFAIAARPITEMPFPSEAVFKKIHWGASKTASLE